MFTWGLTAAVIGGASLVSGVAVMMMGMKDAFCFKWSDGDCPNRAAGEKVVDTGVALVIAGTALLGLGIPLAIVGGRHVKPSQLSPMSASIVPVVGPGTAGSAFTLTF